MGRSYDSPYGAERPLDEDSYLQQPAASSTSGLSGCAHGGRGQFGLRAAMTRLVM